MLSSGDGQVIKAEMDKDVRAYQVVGNSLWERIRLGEFRAIGKLPTERELAEIYGVGRAVVRDALVMLEVKGLIQSRQGSGIYITSRAYEIEPLGSDEASALWNELPPAGPLEFIQAQQWLDSHLTRLAATLANADDLADIQQASEDCRPPCSAAMREDREEVFRQTIARASHNAELVNMAQQLTRRRNNSPLWRNFCAPLNDINDDRWGSHRDKIVDALHRCDADAAFVAMWHYNEVVKEFLIAASRGLEQETQPRGASRRGRS